MTMTKGLDEASTKFFDSLMLHSRGIKLGDKTTRQIKIYLKKYILKKYSSRQPSSPERHNLSPSLWSAHDGCRYGMWI